MKEQTISKATIDRLPLYYRTLRLAQDDGMDIISSDELGRRLELTPEQIRKDLALFGQFGKKGVGYYVNELKFNVGKILGLDNHWNIAIVGIGHLGVALANYQNFIALGFNLVALFDNDPNIIGKTVNHVKVNYKITNRRSGDIAECFADPTKAKDELGWEASLGIEDMCKDSWNYIEKNS